MDNAIPCRLCGGPAAPAFRKTLLGRHDVGYFHCSQCGALETERPYWLDEAYLPANERFDTGQAVRSLANAGFLMALCRSLGFSREKVVDYGGGSGLATRLLRDVGINAYVYDRYSEPRLAMGFQTNDLHGAALVNLCEVAEHFDEPGRYFDAIFASGAQVVVVQTAWLERPDPGWNYLSPENGQHVFFYSARTFEYLAARYRRAMAPLCGYAVFMSEPALQKLYDVPKGTVRPEVAQRMNDSFQALCDYIRMHPYLHATEDHALLASGRS